MTIPLNEKLSAALAAVSEAHANAEGQPGHRTDPTALTQRIIKLGFLECTSQVEPVNPYQAVAQLQDSAKADRDKLRNNVSSSVTWAKRKTGHTYLTEVMTVMSTGNNLYHVAIVTRITE